MIEKLVTLLSKPEHGSSDPAVRRSVESTEKTLQRNAELRAKLAVVLLRYEERARDPRRT